MLFVVDEVVGAVSRLGEDGVDEGEGRDREIAGDRYLELSSLLLVVGAAERREGSPVL